MRQSFEISTCTLVSHDYAPKMAVYWTMVDLSTQSKRKFTIHIHPNDTKIFTHIFSILSKLFEGQGGVPLYAAYAPLTTQQKVAVPL